MADRPWRISTPRFVPVVRAWPRSIKMPYSADPRRDLRVRQPTPAATVNSIVAHGLPRRALCGDTARRPAGLSNRALQRKHRVGYRTVAVALASAWPKSIKPPPKRGSRLDPYLQVIDEWLRDDLDAPWKQRHTATRIFDRLLDEHDAAEVSYWMVREYVSTRRREIRIEAGREHPATFIPQEHLPGRECLNEDLIDGDAGDCMSAGFVGRHLSPDLDSDQDGSGGVAAVTRIRMSESSVSPSEPGGQGVAQSGVGTISHPGDVPVRADYHGGRGAD